MTNRKRDLRPSRRVLLVIARGLEEIKDHFIWEEFSTNEGESSYQDSIGDVGESENDAAEDDDDDEYEEPYHISSFDREDVEVAIDMFISHLIRRKLIRKDKFGEPESMSEVFEKFFGEDDEITRSARSFEDHIKGYFGFIDYENMSAAYSELSEIQELIKRELEVKGSG